jgi:hypothetical protein
LLCITEDFGRVLLIYVIYCFPLEDIYIYIFFNHIIFYPGPVLGVPAKSASQLPTTTKPSSYPEAKQVTLFLFHFFTKLTRPPNENSFVLESTDALDCSLSNELEIITGKIDLCI